MITAVAARWLLTVVFAAAGLGAALPRRGHHGAADAAGPVPVVSCVVMCAALTAMTWRSEPAAAAWAQAAVFGCAALWSALDGLAGPGRTRRPGLPAALHMLMASAMIWMLTAMPASTGMPPAGPRCDGGHASCRRARPGARRQQPARSVLRGRLHPVAGAGHRSRA